MSGYIKIITSLPATKCRITRRAINNNTVIIFGLAGCLFHGKLCEGTIKITSYHVSAEISVPAKQHVLCMKHCILRHKRGIAFCLFFVCLYFFVCLLVLYEH